MGYSSCVLISFILLTRLAEDTRDNEVESYFHGGLLFFRLGSDRVKEERERGVGEKKQRMKREKRERR